MTTRDIGSTKPKTGSFQPVTTDDLPQVRKAENRLNQADVTGVTARNPGKGRNPADDALTLDPVLTGNGAADWLAAHNLEDMTPPPRPAIPPAIPYEKLSKAEKAELARLHAKHRDLADGGSR